MVTITTTPILGRYHHYCCHCRMSFGRVPEDDGSVRCLVCNKLITGIAARFGQCSIRRLDHVHWHCDTCDLTYGAVAHGSEIPKPPICNRERR